jgi:hypothetical protein
MDESNKIPIDWKEYEKVVYNELLPFYIDEEIIFNHTVFGKYSETNRQIDIYIEEKLGSEKSITIIDCKFYSKKVDVKCVEEFMSMAEDVSADSAILITEKGYTSGAYKRAANNPKNFELHIVNFNDLKNHLQGDSAIPYIDNSGVLIKAPLGWTIDIKRQKYSLCMIFPKGEDFTTLEDGKEFAYVNFMKKNRKMKNLKAVANHQLKALKSKLVVSENKLFKAYNKVGFQSMIRITFLQESPYTEIAGYVEFDDFIFFCVLNSKRYNIRRNKTKIRLLIKYVLPMGIINGSTA